MSRMHIAFQLVVATLAPSLAASQDLGLDDPCPVAEIQDTEAAISQPDRYAWSLFTHINQPSKTETKCPDTTKRFGDDGPVVWETWRNVRRTSADAVFRPGAVDPGPWRGQVPPSVRTVDDLVARPLKQAVALTGGDLVSGEALRMFADAAVGEGNEVRMNRDAYMFVRSSGLYDRKRQRERAAQGDLNISFPAGAKEIKANWRRINDADRPRYHWTVFEKEDGSREVWGLTALHITTKDLPNWFWATFEHIDNKTAGPPPGGGERNEGWTTRSVDRFACPTPPHDCERIPPGIGLERAQSGRTTDCAARRSTSLIQSVARRYSPTRR